MIDFMNIVKHQELVWTSSPQDNVLVKRLLTDNNLKHRYIKQLMSHLFDFTQVFPIDADEHYNQFVEQMSKKVFNPNYNPNHEFSGSRYNMDKFLQYYFNIFKKKLRGAYTVQRNNVGLSLDRPVSDNGDIRVVDLTWEDLEDAKRTEELVSFKETLQKVTILQKKQGLSFVKIISIILEVSESPNLRQRDLFSDTYKSISRGDRAKTQFIETLLRDQSAQKTILDFVNLLGYVGCTVRDVDPNKMDMDFISRCNTLSEFLSLSYTPMKPPPIEHDTSKDIWGLQVLRGVPSKGDYNLMELGVTPSSPLDRKDIIRIRQCNAHDLPALKKIKISQLNKAGLWGNKTDEVKYPKEEGSLFEQYRKVAEKITRIQSSLVLSGRDLSVGDKEVLEWELAYLINHLTQLELKLKRYNKIEYTSATGVKLDAGDDVYDIINDVQDSRHPYLKNHKEAVASAPIHLKMEINKIINFHVTGNHNQIEVHYLTDSKGFILKPDSSEGLTNRIPWAIYNGDRNKIIHSSGYILDLRLKNIKSLYEELPDIKERYFSTESEGV